MAKRHNRNTCAQVYKLHSIIRFWCYLAFWFLGLQAAVVRKYNATLISFFIWLLNCHLLCHIKQSDSVYLVFLGNGLVFSLLCHTVALLLHCSNQSITEVVRKRRRPVVLPTSHPHTFTSMHKNTEALTCIQLMQLLNGRNEWILGVLL